MSARLLVTVPAGRSSEREWIARVLLEQHLGQSIETTVWQSPFTTIACTGEDGLLTVADRLLGMSSSSWLSHTSMPEEPLARLYPDACVGRNDLPFAETPGIYWPADDQAAHLPPEECTGMVIPFDLFGSAFFMLTRYEECVSPVSDEHGRFPASASLAVRQGFLDTPIVDQYAELLWAALRRLWPRLQRPSRTYRLWVTHDVDSPYSVFCSGRLRLAATGLKECGGDVLKRRDLKLAARRARATVATLGRGVRADPYFNLHTVMDIDEGHGLRATYFYMADRRGEYGARYSLEDPEIRAVLRTTASRGHDIGLHSGYRSMIGGSTLGSEWTHLRSVAVSLGIEQASWGLRAHYLRWSPETSFCEADAAGADFDATLTYAGQAGFRCGTSREYGAFDLRRSRPLRLVERPLIAMESSVIDPEYMGKGVGEEAQAVFSRLAAQCRVYAGTFALLWHNHRILDASEAQLYEAVLEECL